MVIYKITNLINGKIYVGKSVRNPKNYFGSGKLIKQAINKYGISSFTKEILEVCETLDQLSNREKFWIKELGSQHRGYNIAEGGTGGDTTSNHPNRDEIIEKRLQWAKNTIKDIKRIEARYYSETNSLLD